MAPAFHLDRPALREARRIAELPSEPIGRLPETSGRTGELMLVGLLALAAASGSGMYRKRVHRERVITAPSGTDTGG